MPNPESKTGFTGLQHIRRAGLWIFGTVAPRTASRWFERLMLTPSLYVGRRDGNSAFSDGDHTRVPYGNGWLSLWSWGAGPTVLLLHGWSGRAAHLEEFVAPLRAAGFRVVALDHPAHGRSDGVRTNLLECTAAVLQIAAVVGPVHGIIAHSFGSSTAAMAVKHGLDVNRMVFIGAPVSIPKLTDNVAALVGLPRKVSTMMQQRVAARLGFSWADLDTDRILSDVDVPLLVFHDAGDRDVPLQDGVAIARSVKDGNLVTTSGLGHRGILRDPAVVQQAVEFISVAAPSNSRRAV
ncbi:MAG: alpha/beta fold hydrolase [Gemmatimonadetes bacterium]|nr:alpha/beta fold hydrolase [Gemmatimonadota bacterium]